MIGDAAQYQELTSLYSSYGDRELTELSRGISDLTSVAQEILKAELSRRGLKIASADRSVAAPILTDEDLLDMRSYAALAPADCSFEFESEKAASNAYYALTREDIEAIVISPSGDWSDTRGPRVVVFPKDAERASKILSEPSADSLKAETDDVLEDFALPVCPACGSEETMLESVDPVNQWRCDGCDHTWLDEDVAPKP
jgi:hypothetical protein